MAPYARQCFTMALKAEEGVPGKQGWLTFAQQFPSQQTLTGHSTVTPFTSQETDHALLSLTEYLSKNFSMLCRNLEEKKAQEVIKILWNDILVVMDNLTLPQLHGSIETGRRKWNPRQVSLVQSSIKVKRNRPERDGSKFRKKQLFLQSAHSLSRIHIPSLSPFLFPSISLQLLSLTHASSYFATPLLLLLPILPPPFSAPSVEDFVGSPSIFPCRRGGPWDCPYRFGDLSLSRLDSYSWMLPCSLL